MERSSSVAPEGAVAPSSLPMETTVLIVGAGLSGICVGHDLRAAGIDDFCIVEAAGGPGGTWRHNIYPGAACDIPSHLYCFSFAPNPEWSRVYSPQPEILAYVMRCIDEFGLAPHLHYERTVLAHVFDDDRQRWVTRFEDGSVVSSRFLVRAAGGLHKPSWPDVTGLSTFGGDLTHSARWDPDIDLAGRSVAVIGSAASAIQIVPEAARVAGAVVMFQRTPNYIFPREDRAYTDEERVDFRENPEALAAVRSQMFLHCELDVHPIITGGPEIQAIAREVHRQYLGSQVPDPELRRRLVPDYPVGCKRMLISDDFYPSLMLEHVELVTDAIAAVDATGIITRDGRHRAVDVIVCATGFDLQGHGHSVEVLGAGGSSLAELWKTVPAAHRGVAVPGFPNMFLMVGPNSGTGTVSTVHIIEADSGYVVRCIQLAQDDKLVEPSMQAFTAYNEQLQRRLAGTVWAGSCDSWYKVGGHITALYPGDGREYAADKATLQMDELRLRQATPSAPPPVAGGRRV